MGIGTPSSGKTAWIWRWPATPSSTRVEYGRSHNSNLLSACLANQEQPLTLPLHLPLLYTNLKNQTR